MLNSFQRTFAFRVQPGAGPANSHREDNEDNTQQRQRTLALQARLLKLLMRISHQSPAPSEGNGMQGEEGRPPPPRNIQGASSPGEPLPHSFGAAGFVVALGRTKSPPGPPRPFLV